jgi:hypothetical protein
VPIGDGPRLLDLGVEGVPEPDAQGVQQRGADDRVVLVPDAISGVPLAEGVDDGHELTEPVEAPHDRADHHHQLPALRGHVSPEHGPETGVELEQTLVEELGGAIADGAHRLPGVAHEGDLSRSHGIFSLRFRSPRSVHSPSRRSKRANIVRGGRSEGPPPGQSRGDGGTGMLLH